MSHKKVFDTVNSVVPCTHMCWPVDAPHKLPFAVYYTDSVRSMYADNKLFKRATVWIVELHQYVRNAEIETSLEEAIADAFGSYKISGESWIEDDQCYLIAYSFTEIEKEASNG